MQKWFLAWIVPMSCHYFFLPVHFSTLLALTQNIGSTAVTSQAQISVLILQRINISLLSRHSLMKVQKSTQLAASLTRHSTKNAGSQITLFLGRSKKKKNCHKIHSIFPSRLKSIKEAQALSSSAIFPSLYHLADKGGLPSCNILYWCHHHIKMRALKKHHVFCYVPQVFNRNLFRPQQPFHYPLARSAKLQKAICV